MASHCCWVSLAISSGPSAPGLLAPLGLAGAVGAISDMTAIPLELPVNGASVPAQAFGKSAHAESLRTQNSGQASNGGKGQNSADKIQASNGAITLQDDESFSYKRPGRFTIDTGGFK